MTRNRDLDLQDLFGCDHELEIPISQNGVVLHWRCRCGEKQATVEALERSNAEEKK